jgi:hypothetical protein
MLVNNKNKRKNTVVLVTSTAEKRKEKVISYCRWKCSRKFRYEGRDRLLF